LIAEAPHAEEILSTYADLTELQERVAARVPAHTWTALVDAGDASHPRLRLERLPVDELVPLFADFLREAADQGTDVMRADASALSSIPVAAQRALLAAALGPQASEDEPPPFHVRAFVQSVATTLAEGSGLPDLLESQRSDSVRTDLCPLCARPPVVGSLQDLPGALGSRSLVCGVCGGAWRVPRLTCAHCGETEATRLAVHVAESLPHVRLDECSSCARYLKTVDLRSRGDAVPLVDDLASVELDLWASERGLTRVEMNLFGL
jgi:FdhE protein